MRNTFGQFCKLRLGSEDTSLASFKSIGLSNGTLVNSGVSIFGDHLDNPIANAAVCIGKPLDPEGLSLRWSLEVFGDSHFIGFTLQDGKYVCNGVSIFNNTHTVNASDTTNANKVINGNLRVNGNFWCTRAAWASSIVGTSKLFDIKHPSKENHRLAHACLEGPEVGVYYRGRLTGSNKIELPDYWKDLVHEDSITVQLQPIGDRHFHLNVVSFTNESVIIKEADDKPIDCFYHVYAERKDIDKLVVEYEGDEIMEQGG